MNTTKALEQGSTSQHKEKGFTLIEVLLALAVLAIALTALLKTTASNISNTTRIKEKTLSHWVAMQGVAMAQLGLLPLVPNQEITQVTAMFGQRWYWRVKMAPTTSKNLYQLNIAVSLKQAGPFQPALTAFRYQYNAN